MASDELLGPNGYQARLQRRETVEPLVASMWVVPFSSKPHRHPYYAVMPTKPTRMAVKTSNQFLYVCDVSRHSMLHYDAGRAHAEGSSDWLAVC
jgi:hypothetical protein